MMKKSSAFFVFLLCFIGAKAQTVDEPQRWITNAMMIAVGGQNELDTYLSSQSYTGFSARFISHTERKRDLSDWTTRIVHQGQFFTGDMKQTSDGHELGGIYSFEWGRLYSLPLRISNVDITVGATLDAMAGFLYNTRNSNNPAQARLSLQVAPVVNAKWNFSLFNKPLVLGLELTSPLCGLMFSPQYGQSYYEIFSRGNYDHNCVPTTFVCTPSLYSMLSLDIPIGKSALRVGYIGDFTQSHVNDIKQHSYCHYFMLGYVRKFSIVRKSVTN